MSSAVKRQRGITLIGFLIVLCVLGFFGYIGIRLFPVYSEYYSVVQAMEGLKEEPNVRNMPPSRLRDLFFRRLNVSYVDSVTPANVKFSRSQGYRMRVKYDRSTPMFGNLTLVAHFDRTIDFFEP